MLMRRTVASVHQERGLMAQSQSSGRFQGSPERANTLPPGPPLARLSRRERDVLDLLLQCKTSNEIAASLEIPPHEVEPGLEKVRSKLRARSRAELVLIYSRSLPR